MQHWFFTVSVLACHLAATRWLKKVSSVWKGCCSISVFLTSLIYNCQRKNTDAFSHSPTSMHYNQRCLTRYVVLLFQEILQIIFLYSRKMTRNVMNFTFRGWYRIWIWVAHAKKTFCWPLLSRLAKTNMEGIHSFVQMDNCFQTKIQHCLSVKHVTVNVKNFHNCYTCLTLVV